MSRGRKVVVERAGHAQGVGREIVGRFKAFNQPDGRVAATPPTGSLPT
jgi:hypothetical protein